MRRRATEKYMMLPTFVAATLALTTANQQSMVVVVGAPGEAKFAEMFRAWSGSWQQAAQAASVPLIQIGPPQEADATDKQQLRQVVQDQRSGAGPLWIVMIGHGTFDGEVAKFNLRGEDVSAAELAEWLSDFPRPVAIVNCASSSAPFINRLSGPNRIVVTSTKSGYQFNFSRYGQFMSAAIASREADLDKDEQTSLLEAFIFASGQVREFYETESRLATEHALIDDNGDAMGTPAEWFRGVRADKSPKEGAEIDGPRANQWHLIRAPFELQLSDEARARRDELEHAIEKLRGQKADMDEEAYFNRLEVFLLTLAEVYQILPSEPEVPAGDGQPSAN
jgi:hypothetical protein